MKEQKNICIDISNVIPGKGGAGGGITTYAINFVENLDLILENEYSTVFCLKNTKLDGLTNLKNIKVINISLNNNDFFSRMFWLQVRLPLFCVYRKIDLLHRVIPEMPRIKVCKYIVTVHDFMFDLYLLNPHLKKYLKVKNKFKFYFLRHLSKSAIGISDFVIVPAKAIKKELKQKFNISEKIIVIQEASKKSNPIKKVNNKQKSPLKIGVIAGFYPHKGHFKVLDLAKRFLESGFSEFQIYFRGSKVFKDYVYDLEMKIIEMQLEEYVHFEPFKDKISLAEIYSEYKLVLLLSEYEGFGLPVLEAQAHSVPVVCSDIPIFKENLKDSAIYIDNDFSEENISNLIEKLHDEEFMENIASRGNLNAKQFSWKKMAMDTLDLYNRSI
ncbi:glycosyltransferase family 4 protein [Pleomorphovibrio marinus]|uniref:glycosyltransferase family 4 protein n=1 Tax=Pleomorphovibrio marinus TaxID=2164132 RepID=UPI000E0AD151|nr:glycosyltransferase family 1 protein [Pleomorphovibrio marinus]